MDPKALALRRLTLREYSSAEMTSYLRRKGVDEAEAAAVVLELEERGLIDPGRYAAAIARSQIARGKGPMAVLAKLRRRGLSADLSGARKLYEAEALAAAEGGSGEAEAARKVLAVRYPDLDLKDEKQVQRAYQALLRRGFTPSVVRDLLRP
jgi:SOS response regulatory protein OraA/RecX